MKFELKNCADGAAAVYKTSLEISENEGVLTFIFDAEHSEGYCCEPGYNNIHSLGDVCEILIGTDPKRSIYYEIEINPIGDLMIAEMTNRGVDKDGRPMLDINFVPESFISAKTEKTKNGYRAELSFDKTKINTGDGEIYFNAYRIETDGGEPEKYLFALNPTLEGRFHVPNRFIWLKNCL